jgi:hypothetical protein
LAEWSKGPVNLASKFGTKQDTTLRAMLQNIDNH